VRDGLLRTAVLRLAAPTGAAAAPLVQRARHAALGLLLRSALRRRTLPDLLGALDGEVRTGEGAGEGGPLPRDRRLRTTCLYRSLAGYAAARSRGGDARFVIGLRGGADVIAHAWLELDGRPFGEPTDPRAEYTVAWTHPAAAAGPPDPAPEVNVNALRAAPAVILTELQDGTGVLLHLGTKFYFALNRTGVVAWKLLAAGEAADAAQLAAALVDRFAGVTVERAAADVEALLAELRAEGLLAPAGAG
jgi:hypothetical protein